MKVNVFETHERLAAAAAEFAAGKLREAIRRRGRAVFVCSTGNSQIKFLEALSAVSGVDWKRTSLFHLDDYLGLPTTHPGSFDRYLHERLIDRVQPGAAHLIDGNAPDPEAEALRYSRLISADSVDVCFAGIGETGHLALNDPPADFETERPFFVIGITEASRRQLANEGWFDTWRDCPARAISISIRQILKSGCIISVVPESRKAVAVRNCLENEISPAYPASILRTHADSHLFLDSDSASLLSRFASVVESYPIKFELPEPGA